MQATPAVAVRPAVTPLILPTAATPAAVSQGVNAIAAILTAQPVKPAESQTNPQTAVPPGNVKGTIEGVVTRVGTSEPIPGAWVAIANAPFDPAALDTLIKFWAARGVTMEPQAPGQSDEKYFQTLMDRIAARGLSTTLPENQISIMQFRAANTVRYSAQADARGRFTIPNVGPGVYTLEADQAGFFVIPGRPAIATVEAGKPTNTSVPMLAGGTITGRVKNIAGKLLPNVNVIALQITYRNGRIVPQAQSAQSTDDRGEYRMFWLPPGDYVVLADPPAYPLGTQGPAAPGPRGGVLPPVPMSSPQFMRTFFPQALLTSDARIITIKSGDQMSGMDITVQKGATYKLSGTIHAAPYIGTTPPPTRGRGRGANADPNAPQRIQGYLGLEYRDPSLIDMRSTNLGGSIPPAGNFFLETSADGLRATFEVRDVLPGEYYLVPRVTQAVPTGLGIFNANRVAVDVRDSDVNGLAIELVPNTTVNGILTIDGRPPGNVTARVAIAAVGNPSPTYQGIVDRAVIPNPDDGTFSIANIPHSRYLVEMGAGLPPDLYLSEVRLGAVNVLDTEFEVGRDTMPPPLQVSLRSGAGTVEGVVRDGSARPVPNATAVVIPPEARRENRVLYRTATSDAAGKFSVKGIAPGSYKIFAFEGLSGGEFYNARFLQKYEFRGKSVTVSQGGSSTESLTVIESN
jgi:hypothetical protein